MMVTQARSFDEEAVTHGITKVMDFSYGEIGPKKFFPVDTLAPTSDIRA